MPSIFSFFFAEANCGAIPALRGFRLRPVNLVDDGVVHIAAESALNGFQIRLMAVGSQLHAVGKARGQVVHEPHGAFAVATADEVGNDHLGVRVDSGPSPRVASIGRRSRRGRNVLLLGVGEAPNFIDLNTLRRDVAHVGVMVGPTHLAGVDQKFGDGILARARDAGNGADRLAFAEKVEDAGAIFGGQLVHAFKLTDPSE